MALLNTPRTCSRPMPYLFRAVGFSSIRTARQRASSHDHLAHAAHLRKFLRQNRRGGIVHLAFAEHVGGERKDENRRIGRIHFAVGRVIGKIGRQVAAGGVDGGLNVARRSVDVPVQIELQRNAGGSEATRRGHFGDRRQCG